LTREVVCANRNGIEFMSLHFIRPYIALMPWSEYYACLKAGIILDTQLVKNPIGIFVLIEGLRHKAPNSYLIYTADPAGFNKSYGFLEYGFLFGKRFGA